jgi:YVTN family beta-propeller protein
MLRSSVSAVVASLLVPCTLRAAAQSSFVNWETPHVHPVDLTPDGAKLLAVNLADARLEVFDVRTGLPVPIFSVPVGLDPSSVRARTSTEAWVVNRVSDSVSVVDLVTRSVVATLTTEDEPADVVFAGTPERAFVSCSETDRVLVFDPASLAAAPLVVSLGAEDPRALATSPARDVVYVASFSSGNGTTILGGGAVTNVVFPPNVVSDPAGPYGGVNPPPNRAAAFDPPLAAGLPPPPAVGLIVRQAANGAWMDDNGGDWTAFVSGASAGLSGRPVGWTLVDHDLIAIDAASLAVSYVDRLMTADMALAVAPSGELAVVGTEATNEIRFEPNLTGRFVRSKLALVDPLQPAAASVVDLNGHLAYATGTVPQSERDKSLADPRAAVWNAAGTRLYVAGLGSNNLVVLDASGARAGLAPTIEVGEGPTGLALDEPRAKLYVMNKHGASISVVDTLLEMEVARVSFHDATPSAIRVGRKYLYDARRTSGLGVTACAACHVDARMDHLAWDLGNPAGSMKSPSASGQNLGANVPGLNTGFQDWHPMKGPMTTQTLVDIIGKEPHHWRGDRNGIEEFNGAFQSLLGDDVQLSAAEMQEFESFLATITFPPNPFRGADNSLPTNLVLNGHHTTGRFSAAGQPLPVGNATSGLALYRPPRLLDTNALACVTCHTLPTGLGTDRRFQNGQYRAIAAGPNGERHHALVSVDGSTNVSMKIPQLRNLYQKTGFDLTQTLNTRGFGLLHDGSVDSIERFVSEPVFSPASDQEVANLVAFLLAFSGSNLPSGSATNVLEPPGTLSQDTHAAVGDQLTLANPNPDPATLALLDAMLQQANLAKVDVIVKGRLAGAQRGWKYSGGAVFQSDRKRQTHSKAELLALAGVGREMTFSVVPKGSATRLGIDRDMDGAFDRDEELAGSDPADPASLPGKVQSIPPRQGI